MKVVKLHPRNIGWKHGFTHALRFDSWDADAARIHEFLRKTYNTATYDKQGPYYEKFGRKDKTSNLLSYWIYLRHEADITLLLLKGS